MNTVQRRPVEPSNDYARASRFEFTASLTRLFGRTSAFRRSPFALCLSFAWRSLRIERELRPRMRNPAFLEPKVKSSLALGRLRDYGTEGDRLRAAWPRWDRWRGFFYA